MFIKQAATKFEKQKLQTLNNSVYTYTYKPHKSYTNVS